MTRDDIVDNRDRFNSVRDIVYDGWAGPPSGMTDDQIIAALVDWAKVRRYSIQDIVVYGHNPHTCGCLGPQAGAPFCPCAMSGWLEAYRYDVALRLWDEQHVN